MDPNLIASSYVIYHNKYFFGVLGYIDEQVKCAQFNDDVDWSLIVNTDRKKYHGKSKNFFKDKFSFVKFLNKRINFFHVKGNCEYPNVEFQI